MAQGSLNPKIAFLGQKVWPVARSPIILGYFFPTITMEISTFHFRTFMIQGGNFSKLSINLKYRTYEREVVDIDITMACDISI